MGHHALAVVQTVFNALIRQCVSFAKDFTSLKKAHASKRALVGIIKMNISHLLHPKDIASRAKMNAKNALIMVYARPASALI